MNVLTLAQVEALTRVAASTRVAAAADHGLEAAPDLERQQQLADHWHAQRVDAEEKALDTGVIRAQISQIRHEAYDAAVTEIRKRAAARRAEATR